jgi:hypothetical protein
MSSDLQIGKDLLNTPLTMEMYQRIHATALQRAIRGLHLYAVPSHIDVEQLKQLVAHIGFDGCLIHPSDVERIFAGVTLKTYQTIRELYCSRLGRSIAMVYRILQRLRQQESLPVPTYEAVWAICLYLEKRRRESVDVSVARTTGGWWIGKLSPAVRIQVEKDAFYLPGIICIIDTHTQHMLAFRIAPLETLAESIPLALYDAIAAQRQPHPYALAGLLWQLPRRISTEETLSPECSTICRRMGIQVETTGCTQPLLEALRDTWATGLEGRILPRSRCAAILDSFLERIHGYGPLREGERRDEAFAQAQGYNQDPAALFPLLRALLPERKGIITDEGLVIDGYLRYSDELLRFWPRTQVTSRHSAHATDRAWIFLEGEVLCQAKGLRQVRDGGSRL